MQKVRILDCTLRDGGYCNEWEFGNANIVMILEGLKRAQIDIVECGFLTEKAKYSPETSRFNSLDQIKDVLPQKDDGTIYVCMINHGEYDVHTLPKYDGTSVDGIRVAFHKKNLTGALEMCKVIKDKGYKVFVQPMVSLNYSDTEFLDLIYQCNKIQPYAFYIVDSFGVMKRKDLMRLFYTVEHNLDSSISIGFHSHNNMQLAYSNAQALVDIRTNRDIIIDSSVFGMGRGAGNLNTELFIEYLNDNIGTAYSIKPLLNIIDDVLVSFYQKRYWGYSLPNYLSAKHNAHPNYAGYLMEKHTLTVDNMDEIFSVMAEEKKAEYDVAYIEQLYVAYLAKDTEDEECTSEFIEKICGKKVLLIAPGRSAEEEKEKIISFCEKENVVSISINFQYAHCNTDYVFVSNLRRFRQLENYDEKRTIVTSNIPVQDAYITVEYKKLLNDIEAVKDNAGLMLIKYLISLGAGEIYLAGMDGYSHELGSNFAKSELEFASNNEKFDAMNNGIEKVLNQYSEEIKLSFLTNPKHIRVKRTDK